MAVRVLGGCVAVLAIAFVAVAAMLVQLSDRVARLETRRVLRELPPIYQRTTELRCTRPTTLERRL